MTNYNLSSIKYSDLESSLNSASLSNLLKRLSLELWERLKSLTLGNERLQVLESVVRDWFTLLLISSDHLSVALEVGWEELGTILDSFHVLWESLLEDLVDLHSVGNLLVEFIIVLQSWLRENHIVPEVEVVVSGVNSKLVLSGDLCLVDVKDVLDESLLGVVLDLLPGVLLVHVFARFEVSDWLVGEGELTPLQDVRLGCFFLHGVELILEGLNFHVGYIRILKPVDRE